MPRTPRDLTRLLPKVGLQHTLAAVALCFGLALTALVWDSSLRHTQTQAQAQFNARTDEMQAALEARLHAYALTLRGAAAYVGTIGHPEQDQWQHINHTLGISGTIPGLVATAYLRDIPGGELIPYLNTRSFIEPGFSLKPPGEREHHVLITQVEPRTAHNLNVLGSDSWANDDRRATLESARDYADTRITGQLVLVHDTQPEPAFIMYQAVYRNSVILPTVAERRAQLLGYVAIGFHIQGLMRSTLGHTTQDIALSIFDSAQPSPAQQFFASHPPNTHTPALLAERTLSIAGRLWSLRFESLPEFERLTALEDPRSILWLGSLLSLLLALIVWALLNTRARALSLAGQMTASLRTSETKLRAIFEQAPIAIWTVDRDGSIIENNPVLARYVGAPQPHLAGFNMLHDARDQCLADPVRRALAGETLAFESAYRSTTGDREGYYSFHFQPVSIDGRTQFVLAFAEDISERQKTRLAIEHLAHHDQLTGLSNRSAFNARLAAEIARVKRSHDRLAVMFLDLDHFKEVNDTLGHSCGDRLLVEVARRLQACLRETDALGRIGGDEFVIIATQLAEPDGARAIAEKIIAALAAPVVLDEHPLQITTSVGIALWPADGETAEDLLKNADAALYAAKDQGRNTARFFTEELNRHNAESQAMERALRQALNSATNELSLHFQPQVDARSGQISGAETLLRWQNPGFGHVSPARFIPLAETRGLIDALGAWVLQQTCRQMRAWDDAGLPLVPTAVNISALQFRRGTLCEHVFAALDEHGIAAQHLVLEITESAIMEDVDAAVAQLEQLRARGVAIEIDDFGTGYSSLASLKRLPIHRLKIDQSFVHDMQADSDDAAIVSAIISMAASLRLGVIAEGVETATQRDFLLAAGCHAMQGYFYARPEPATQFAERLAALKGTDRHDDGLEYPV